MTTGKVTQFALDIGPLIGLGFKSTDLRSVIGKELITLGGFLARCIIGAIIGHHLGG
jgi:hypothetical protein